MNSIHAKPTNLQTRRPRPALNPTMQEGAQALLSIRRGLAARGIVPYVPDSRSLEPADPPTFTCKCGAEVWAEGAICDECEAAGRWAETQFCHGGCGEDIVGSDGFCEACRPVDAPADRFDDRALEAQFVAQVERGGGAVA